MRSFTPALDTQLARRDGATPVWILRFAAGGHDYILCQDAVPITPWAVTALPWIVSWGQLIEGITGTLADFNIASLNVNLVNDPSDVLNLRGQAKARALNGVSVSVYLWADGCTDPPFEMYRFRVTDIDLPDETSVNLTLQDESSRYENYYPGTVITKAAYPSADPDDIGKIIPIPFGTVSRLMAVALDAGRMTSIPNAVNSSTTSIIVSDATGLAAGMSLQINDEIVAIGTVAGNTLTVTRGASGSLAAPHQRGAMVWEVKDEFVYAVADYPLNSMPKAYGRVGQGPI